MLEEEQLRACHTALTWAMVVVGAGVFVVTMCGVRAPYGRYARNAKGILGLIPMNSHFAWVLQESPSFVVALALVLCLPGNREEQTILTRISMTAFFVHYFHRVVIYPINFKSESKSPAIVVFLAFTFCCWNSFIQVRPFVSLFFTISHHATSMPVIECNHLHMYPVVCPAIWQHLLYWNVFTQLTF